MGCHCVVNSPKYKNTSIVKYIVLSIVNKNIVQGFDQRKTVCSFSLSWRGKSKPPMTRRVRHRQLSPNADGRRIRGALMRGYDGHPRWGRICILPRIPLPGNHMFFWHALVFLVFTCSASVTCDVFGCVVRSRRMNPFLVDFLFLPVRCRVQFVSPVSYWRLYDSP